jgi:hypothetical protein
MQTMREEEMFCKVSHLLANKTHFLPNIVIKLRATSLVLQLTINDSHFALRTNVPYGVSFGAK